MVYRDIETYNKINNGYHHINLEKDGKPRWYYLHRLVAQTFFTIKHNPPQVDNRDQNEPNNNVETLRW
jgi:hypothetical protein